MEKLRGLRSLDESVKSLPAAPLPSVRSSISSIGDLVNLVISGGIAAISPRGGAAGAISPRRGAAGMQAPGLATRAGSLSVAGESSQAASPSSVRGANRRGKTEAALIGPRSEAGPPTQPPALSRGPSEGSPRRPPNPPVRPILSISDAMASSTQLSQVIMSKGFKPMPFDPQSLSTPQPPFLSSCIV